MPAERNNQPRNKIVSKAPQDALSSLRAFDCLEVGPVKLEPSRLIAPYSLHYNGKMEQTELIYTYEESVFDPAEPESQNLAAMMVAQVALNYGLFCDALVFHGPYDDIDQRFIRNMAENTAREIYVKKFLEPNPFLVGPAADLSPEKQRTYLRAELQFPDFSRNKKKPVWQLWPSRRDRHCVPYSGGKDSLLSYGLLNEMGREVHPIFVNESGRHWFTALNAYRHFKDHIPQTARVWVNSDRIFSWMLRRMPFIRRDFSNVRSDEYPIRLWTVAVFLFGALPLMRKRGIGRLLIGDEFDTSVRKTFHGIRHYDGLYDQSIYFDQAMTNYFRRKGWAISQFSILRPLSELLIEKILALRYPQLQRHQTSCHATHKEGGRIHPCGRCEKCRRIVSMLLALDVDPAHCGYRASHIEDSLRGFIEKGVAQETAGSRQLGFMLIQRGLIDVSSQRRKLFREQPEVLNLRYDPGVSPMNSIPVDLRKPLLTIFMQYASGAMRRIGKKWMSVDPFDDPGLNQSFAFEHDNRGLDVNPKNDTRANDQPRHLWGQLTWPEAQKRFEQVDIALLPVGSIEQHGPHLPLDTDAFDANHLALRIAEACSQPKPLVLPGISYGVAYHHEDFKGTVSISNDTLSRLVYDIGISISRSGIKKLVIINGHGGNSPALNYAAQMINRDAHIFVCVDTGETSDVDVYSLVETPNDVHAGEIETSAALAVRPHLVNMDLARREVPEFSSRYLDFTSKRGVSWYAYTRRISQSGVMGDPTKASIEKGNKIWEMMITHLVALIEDLKSMTLDEIHHRNY
ncbi:MAG: creatininase family protein [Deltaproteobacteria bacterium]|jgi:creatinine amidohydrolase/Fe(II)-dependent formamide hydrolase-like protein/7-cyano-7-deazaguanine synthase in queuosine biosynthesis|nr:creatininase family protein [Deltaproteobacteria bacterium]